MGKLKMFDISFANRSGVFYAGTPVQGQVTIELSEPMKMRGICIKFKGEAKVHWKERKQEGSGDNRRTVTKHYRSHEKYLDEELLLFGIWQGSDTKELEAGRHQFPFEFLLPGNIPSSYESRIGRIRYVVKGKIDKPWKFDHTTKRPFTVISILDLNSDPQYAQALVDSDQKHLCCLCCKSGPIQATLRLDRKGFVPGEAICVNAEISNGSNRTMDHSTVNLKMVTKYHAKGKTRRLEREIARLTHPAIPGNGDDIWNGDQLVIPPLPPSFLLGCKIIEINYYLKLAVIPSGIAMDLKIPFEIVIGTIPLMSVIQQNPPMMPGEGAPNDVMFPPLPNAIPNMPPPSYNECITGKVKIREKDDNEHTFGQFEYAPMYTYYNWGHAPTIMPKEGESSSSASSSDEEEDE